MIFSFFAGLMKTRSQTETLRAHTMPLVGLIRGIAYHVRVSVAIIDHDKPAPMHGDILAIVVIDACQR